MSCWNCYSNVRPESVSHYHLVDYFTLGRTESHKTKRLLSKFPEGNCTFPEGDFSQNHAWNNHRSKGMSSLRQKLCRSRDSCVEQAAIESTRRKLSFRSFRRLLKTHWFTADHSAMWTIIYCAIEIHLLTYLPSRRTSHLRVDILISSSLTSPLCRPIMPLPVRATIDRPLSRPGISQGSSSEEVLGLRYV